MKENLPNLEKEIDTSPGSTENPKQDRPRDAHSKTCYNENANG